MAKTRGQLGTKLRDFVGPGKEFLPSEVPTLRAVLQRGILLRESILREEGRAKTVGVVAYRGENGPRCFVLVFNNMKSGTSPEHRTIA